MKYSIHQKTLASTALWAASLVCVLPMIVAVHISFSGRGWEDYRFVLFESPFRINLFNSFFITSITVLLICGVVLTGGYGFSKIRFRGKNIFYFIVLSMIMFPVAVIIVPLFAINRSLGLMNTYWGVIGPYVALIAPFNLVLAKNFFDGIPEQITEAAVIDGCTVHRVFTHMFVPLSKPIIVTIAVWASINTWNEYLLALVFLRPESMHTLTLFPNRFLQQFQADIPRMFAALILIIIPPLFLYLILQRKIRMGLVGGSVKA